MKAIAIFDQRNVAGYVLFKQENIHSSVEVTINLFRLKGKRTRAIHIHEFGDTSDGCKSLGGHWNPTHETHGSYFIPGMPCHSGDLINNITPNSKGEILYTYKDERLNLIGNVNESIIGRSVVIHDGIDDLGLGGLDEYGYITNLEKHKESLKTGNAGSRMACAIIGITNNS